MNPKSHLRLTFLFILFFSLCFFPSISLAVSNNDIVLPEDVIELEEEKTTIESEGTETEVSDPEVFQEESTSEVIETEEQDSEEVDIEAPIVEHPEDKSATEDQVETENNPIEEADEEIPTEEEISEETEEETPSEEEISEETEEIIPPEAVTNLHTYHDEEGNICLGWDSSEGADGYVIRRQIGKDQFIEIAVIEETTYKDLTAANNEYNFYRIHPFKLIDGERLLGDSITYVWNYKKLSQITDVSVEIKAFGKVLLNWSPHPETDGYLIYRKTGTGPFSYRYVLNDLSFLDSTASGEEESTYRVYPFIRRGNKLLTGLVSETAPLLANRLPRVENFQGGVIESATVEFKWDPVPYATSYLLYRKDQDNQNVFVSEITSGTSYIDKKAHNYKINRYTIFACEKSESGKRIPSLSSNIVSAYPRLTAVKSTSAENDDGEAILNWEEVNGAPFYAIYRKVSAQGELKFLFARQGNYIKAIERLPQMGEYNFYFIRPYCFVDGKQIIGPHKSGVYSWVKPKMDPVKLSSSDAKDGARLSWSKSKRATSYTVWKEQNGKRVKIAETTSPSYLDRSALKRIYGKYWVQPLYEDAANALSIKGPYSKPTQARKKIDMRRAIAITFDDGPVRNTTAILNALKKYDAAATFFVLGSQTFGNEDILRRMHNEGHEIGNHSYDHPELPYLSSESIRWQINRTDQLIRSATGSTTKVFRPPYGSYTSRVLYAANKPAIMWSVDTRDWANRDASHLYYYLLNNTRNGDVVLMHDIHPSTVNGFINALPELSRRGFEFVTVSELMEYKGASKSAGSVFYGR